MQPRTGKHKPVPGGPSIPGSSPDRLPAAPLGLGSPATRQGLGPLGDVSPNVPLLPLSPLGPSGTKLSPSPNGSRRPSFGPLVSPGRGGTPPRAAAAGLGPFVGSPGSLFAMFGEIADLSKLGDLPTEDDISLKLFDPLDERAAAAADVPAALPLPQPLLQPGHIYMQSQHSFAFQQHQQLRMGHAAPLWVPQQAPYASGAPAPAGYSYRSSEDEHLLHMLYGAGAGAGPTPEPQQQQQQQQQRAKRRSREETSGSSGGSGARRQRLSGAYTGSAGGSGSSTPGAADRQRQQQQARQQQQQARARDYDDDPGANTGKTYRGVSRHRLTQRWEASLWLNGRQLYLGGFDAQEDAARAYDLAALACKGMDAVINFPSSQYEAQLREVAGFSREEVVAYVRRRSAAFSRGKSKYRGVSGHNGRWEARIGSFNGRKNVSFGVFETEEGAARQYDRALILEKGRSAKTNFPLRDYEAEVEAYVAHMSRVCAGLPRGSSAALREAQAYTMPRDRTVTPDERKRAAIIYGGALRQALDEC